MIRLPTIMGVAVLSIAALSSCTPQQQAVVSLPAVYQTVTDPNVSVETKACTVLDWGLPIARERVNKLTGNQLALANGAAAAAAGYCTNRDASWQARAVQAADVLSKVLWDIYK